MLLGKRGEIDNKILFVLVLVVAVILLSNNGMFTGKVIRTFNPQATGSEMRGIPNVYSTSLRSTSLRSYGSLVTNPVDSGSGLYSNVQTCEISLDCGPRQCLGDCWLVGWTCQSIPHTDPSTVGYDGICVNTVINCCANGGHCQRNGCVYPPYYPSYIGPGD